MRLATFYFVAAGLFMAVSFAWAEGDETRAVTVSGTGIVESPPDQVVLTISATTEGDDLLETRRESDSELQEIVELGELHGVRPENFRVTRLKISYGFDEDRRRFFYRVDRDANMNLKEISKFDTLLAAALQRGGFNITGIVFGTSNGQSHEAEAHRRAVEAARAKAEQLAELNGLKLGMARLISEDHFSQRPFATSVVPVVAARTPSRARNATPGGLFSVADSAPRRAPPAPARLVGFTQVATDNDDSAKPQVKSIAAGLGVIETSAGVTIEFELIRRSP